MQAGLPPGIPCDFHVVGSVCLLSQLLEPLVHSLGARHPELFRLVAAVRLRHLQLLADSLVPGGAMLLVTDIVSSATVPRLGEVPHEQLPEFVGRLIEQRNFFTGLNPFVIHHLLTTDPELTSRFAEVQLIRPWLWNLGPRTYAVCALAARRASCSDPVERTAAPAGDYGLHPPRG